jgi:hypothetical protein
VFDGVLEYVPHRLNQTIGIGHHLCDPCLETKFHARSLALDLRAANRNCPLDNGLQVGRTHCEMIRGRVGFCQFEQVVHHFG